MSASFVRACLVPVATLLAACGGEPAWEPTSTEDGGPAETGPGLADGGGAERDAEPARDAAPEPDGEPAEDGGSSGGDAGAADGGAEPAGPRPIDELDDLRLFVNIGDSLAAGYNAAGGNGRGGQGYARLLLENHPSRPAFASHSLSALFPGVELRDLGDSGATSAEALANLRSALRGSLPARVDGDVLVTLTCGGNDFNDDWTRMALAPVTRAVAASLQANYREIVRLLRERYERPELGHRVVFLVTNVHDPTGGTGSVPAEFDDDFCGTIQAFPAPVRSVAVSNLQIFNDAIAAVTEELGAHLVDNHDVFLEHGMGAGSARWIDDDCVHPTSEGHHQLRRRHWLALTGVAL